MVKAPVKVYFIFLLFITIESSANDSTCTVLFAQARERVLLYKYAEAIPLLDSCIKKAGGDAYVNNLRGCATVLQSSLNDDKNNLAAIGSYTKAIRSDSSNSWFYNNRGWSHQFLENYTAALKDFKKASSLDTTDVYLYGNVLRVLWLQKKNKEAYAYSEKLIKLFPTDGYAYYVRGQLKRDYLHKYPEGNKDIKKSEELGWQQGVRLYY